MVELNVFYKRDDNYRLIPVTGIYGGITPQGLISADLFVDKPSTPEHITVSIDERGNATESAISRQDVTRELLVGLLVNPQIARVMGSWLISKADEYDKLILGGKK